MVGDIDGTTMREGYRHRNAMIQKTTSEATASQPISTTMPAPIRLSTRRGVNCDRGVFINRNRICPTINNDYYHSRELEPDHSSHHI